jgi:hypothetical protein
VPEDAARYIVFKTQYGAYNLVRSVDDSNISQILVFFRVCVGTTRIGLGHLWVQLRPIFQLKVRYTSFVPDRLFSGSLGTLLSYEHINLLLV